MPFVSNHHKADSCLCGLSIPAVKGHLITSTSLVVINNKKHCTYHFLGICLRLCFVQVTIGDGQQGNYRKLQMIKTTKCAKDTFLVLIIQAL